MAAAKFPFLYSSFPLSRWAASPSSVLIALDGLAILIEAELARNSPAMVAGDKIVWLLIEKLRGATALPSLSKLCHKKAV